MAGGPPVLNAGVTMKKTSLDPDHLVKPPRVRSNFPETWLWMETETG
jgi:hypothetical protein